MDDPERDTPLRGGAMRELVRPTPRVGEEGAMDEPVRDTPLRGGALRELLVRSTPRIGEVGGELGVLLLSLDAMADPVRCTPRRGGEPSLPPRDGKLGVVDDSIGVSESSSTTRKETFWFRGGAAMDDIDRWIPAPRQKLPSLREGKRGGAMDDLERSTPARQKLSSSSSSSSSNLEGRLGGAMAALDLGRPDSMMLGVVTHLLLLRSTTRHFAENCAMCGAVTSLRVWKVLADLPKNQETSARRTKLNDQRQA